MFVSVRAIDVHDHLLIKSQSIGIFVVVQVVMVVLTIGAEQAGSIWFGKSDLCWCESSDTRLHISNVIGGMGSPFAIGEGQ